MRTPIHIKRTRTRVLSLPLSVLVALVAAVAALLFAMTRPVPADETGALVNGRFENGDFTGWATIGGADVTGNAWEGLGPQQGNYYAHLTGYALDPPFKHLSIVQRERG